MCLLLHGTPCACTMYAYELQQIASERGPSMLTSFAKSNAMLAVQRCVELNQ